jgi:hypothetical protein
MSPSRTGPLTLRMMERVLSSRNSTRTWVTPPREPVRPRTLVTLAFLTGCLLESWRIAEEGEMEADGQNSKIIHRSRSPAFRQSMPGIVRFLLYLSQPLLRSWCACLSVPGSTSSCFVQISHSQRACQRGLARNLMAQPRPANVEAASPDRQQRSCHTAC